MNKLTQEQKEKIYNHGRSLGVEHETLKLIIPQVTIDYEEVLSTTKAHDFIAGVFGWLESEQGHEFWYNIYCSHRGFKPQKEQMQDYQEEVPLSQADVQVLLSLTRVALKDASSDKECFKTLAAQDWTKCNKLDTSTQVYFDIYSSERKIALESKQREKKLVALITKLKAMR